MGTRNLGTQTVHRVLWGWVAIALLVGLSACGASGGETTQGRATATALVASTATSGEQATPTPTTSDQGGPVATPTTPLTQLTVYVGSDGSGFYGLNAGTGALRWQTTISGTANKPFPT